jgi:hypothetical protein
MGKARQYFKRFVGGLLILLSGIIKAERTEAATLSEAPKARVAVEQQVQEIGLLKKKIRKINPLFSQNLDDKKIRDVLDELNKEIGKRKGFDRNKMYDSTLRPGVINMLLKAGATKKEIEQFEREGKLPPSWDEMKRQNDKELELLQAIYQAIDTLYSFELDEGKIAELAGKMDFGPIQKYFVDMGRQIVSFGSFRFKDAEKWNQIKAYLLKYLKFELASDLMKVDGIIKKLDPQKSQFIIANHWGRLFVYVSEKGELYTVFFDWKEMKALYDEYRGVY